MTKIVELKAGRIMQKSDLVSMDPEKMTAFMAEVANSGMPVKFVDSIPHFFSTKNIIDCVDAVDVENLKLIAEHRNMMITDDEYDLMNRMKELKTSLIARIESTKPGYSFAKVPTGWTVENDLIINKNSVRRSRDSKYSIGIKTLQKLWEHASKTWFSGDSISSPISVNAGGYTRSAGVGKNAIQIGCQTIERFELEQLAVHFYWDFPK